MPVGRIVVIATLVLATAGAFGTVIWLRQLQGVAAKIAETPCRVPDERACSVDVDCVEVSCPDNCRCNENCGKAVSREVLKKERHVCLLPRMEPRVPVACISQNLCKCESWSCRREPKCIHGRCEMAHADGGTAPSPPL